MVVSLLGSCPRSDTCASRIERVGSAGREAGVIVVGKNPLNPWPLVPLGR